MVFQPRLHRRMISCSLPLLCVLPSVSPLRGGGAAMVGRPLRPAEQPLSEALHFIQHFQHTMRDCLPDAISLDFASLRWQALIRTRHQREPVLNRRHLEVCVFHYLDHGLRCGDVYVEGSDAYADYRLQLLPWNE